MNDIFFRLSKSTFRSKFHLEDKDIEYINKVGLEKIESHAYDFVIKRLKTKLINDGKQTPMKGQPVFIAEHATATCCRSCLKKWHNIEEFHDLTDEEIQYIVDIIMTFIKKELSKVKT